MVSTIAAEYANGALREFWTICRLNLPALETLRTFRGNSIQPHEKSSETRLQEVITYPLWTHAFPETGTTPSSSKSRRTLKSLNGSEAIGIVSIPAERNRRSNFMKSDSSQRIRSTNQRQPSSSAGARWDIHADVIERIQRHVDTNGRNPASSGRTADTAQLWQKMAMDRIAVLLNELTSSTSAVIQQFNRNPRSFDMDAFIEYLDRSTEQAIRLADQIADFSNFGKSNGGVSDPMEISSGGLERRTRKKR